MTDCNGANENEPQMICALSEKGRGVPGCVLSIVAGTDSDADRDWFPEAIWIRNAALMNGTYHHAC